MKKFTDEDARELAQRTREANRNTPRITAANYKNGRLFVQFAGVQSDGVEASIPVRALPFLAHLSDEQIKDFRISPSGTALLWPQPGVCVTVASLLNGVLKPEILTSPLDVEGISLGLSGEEIMEFVREGRERF